MSIVSVLDNLDKITDHDLEELISRYEEEIKNNEQNIEEKSKMIIQIERQTKDKRELLECFIRIRESRRVTIEAGSQVGHAGESNYNSTRPFEAMNRADAIRKLFRDCQKPLAVSEIMRMLKEGGFPFRTSNVEQSVRNALARNQNDFERTRKNTYRLKNHE